MPAKKTILFLVLSVLIALPAGIANAEIDVDNGDTRVRINDSGGILIDRDDDDSSYRYRDRSSRSRTRVRAPQSRYLRLRDRLRYPRNTTTRSLKCSNGRSVTQQRTVTSRSGTSSNRTYSSVTTTTCR